MSVKMSVKYAFDSDEGKTRVEMRVEMRVERGLNCKFSGKINCKYS